MSNTTEIKVSKRLAILTVDDCQWLTVGLGVSWVSWFGRVCLVVHVGNGESAIATAARSFDCVRLSTHMKCERLSTEAISCSLRSVIILFNQSAISAKFGGWVCRVFTSSFLRLPR